MKSIILRTEATTPFLSTRDACCRDSLEGRTNAMPCYFLARAAVQLFPEWRIVLWRNYPQFSAIVIRNYLKWQKMARERSRAARETLNPTISSVLVRSAMFSFTWNIDGAG